MCGSGWVGWWVGHICCASLQSHTISSFRYFSLFCGLETLSVSSSCFLFPLPNPFSSISFFCFLASSLTLVLLPSPSFLPLLFFPLSCSIIYIPLSFRYHPFLLFLYYSILSSLNTHSTPLHPVTASLPFFPSYLSFNHIPIPFFLSFLFSCISFPSFYLFLPLSLPSLGPHCCERSISEGTVRQGSRPELATHR